VTRSGDRYLGSGETPGEAIPEEKGAKKKGRDPFDRRRRLKADRNYNQCVKGRELVGRTKTKSDTLGDGHCQQGLSGGCRQGSLQSRRGLEEREMSFQRKGREGMLLARRELRDRGEGGPEEAKGKTPKKTEPSPLEKK